MGNNLIRHSLLYLLFVFTLPDFCSSTWIASNYTVTSTNDAVDQSIIVMTFQQVRTTIECGTRCSEIVSESFYFIAGSSTCHCNSVKDNNVVSSGAPGVMKYGYTGDPPATITAAPTITTTPAAPSTTTTPPHTTTTTTTPPTTTTTVTPIITTTTPPTTTTTVTPTITTTTPPTTTTTVTPTIATTTPPTTTTTTPQTTKTTVPPTTTTSTTITTPPTTTTTPPTTTTTVPQNTTTTVPPTTTIAVYTTCNDMSTGWTVFQRRLDGSVDFLRNWVDYVNGFGNTQGEFWLGLEPLYQAVSAGCELCITMEAGPNPETQQQTGYAMYSSFTIGNVSTDYQLTISNFSGSVGDSLLYHNNKPFSTPDNDWYGCADAGAWWFGSCHYSSLNGLYLNGVNTQYGNGINWRLPWGYDFSLLKTEMAYRC